MPRKPATTRPAKRRKKAAKQEPETAPEKGSGPIGFGWSWAVLLAGLALLASVVLIPAQRGALVARNERDIALAKEEHLLKRLDSYNSALEELQQRDEVALEAWRTSQLNRWPEGRRPLNEQTNLGAESAPVSIFASLEPDPVRPELTEQVDSPLSWIATHSTIRLWAIALGAGMVFAGLLPPSGKPGS